MNALIVAERLRALRAKKGESQQEVADAVGVTVSAYSMYERGERVPRDHIKIRIAEHFKRSVNFIFYAPEDTLRER